jgi:hypothetical protein
MVALKIVQHALMQSEGGTLAGDVLATRIAAELVLEPGKRDTRNQRATKLLESLVDKKYLHAKSGNLSLTTAEETEDF